MSVASIFQFIGISFIPVALTVLIYVGFKELYKRLELKDSKDLPKLLNTEKKRYWVRQVTVGLLLGAFSIGCYFLGVKVGNAIDKTQDIRVGVASFFPVLSGLVFGWPSALITTGVGAIFRVCVPSFIRWASFTACVLSGVLVAIAGKFLFENRRSKWYFAFFTGLFVEALNMLLLFLFHLRYIGDAYKTISQFDMLCMLCNAFACAITCLLIQIIEKESILFNVKKNKGINSRVQIRLLIICLLGLMLTSTASYIVTYADALDTIETELYNGSYDMHYDFNTMKARTSPFYCVNRHVVSDGGFCLTVVIADKDGKDLNLQAQQEIIEEMGGQTDYIKGSLFGVPNNIFKQYKSMIGTEVFKFDDETTPESLSPNTMSKDFYSCQFTYAIKSLNGIEYMVSCSKEKNDDQPEGKTDTYCDYFYSLVFIPTSEVTTSAGISYRVAFYINLLIFVSIFAIIYSVLDRKVIKNIQTMDAALERIMEGNLNEEIVLKGSYKEFEQLSNNINLTVGALKNYGEEIERRIASELDFAKEIQENSLPTVFPNEETYNIYAMMNTAKEVGGDFYDCFKMNNGRIMILIADVSGKGIPAAMFMMRARTLIKSLTLQDASVADIATQTNNMLIENNEAGIFVTAWLGILDPATGELNFVNAGHCEPLLKSNGKYELFHNHHQLVLAGMKDYQYQSETVYLKPGEEILLYTDGVTEATDKNYHQYGTDRLISFVNNAKYFNAKQLLTEISDDVARFEGYSDQFDDITMLSLRYIGANLNRPENVLTLKAFPRNASVAINYVESILTREGVNIDPKYVPQMSIVVDELFANVAYHAYPKGVVGELTIEVDIKDDILYLTFVDGGTPFDPTLPFKADTTSGINERKQGGLGIFLVKKAVDKLTYERKNNMNHLYIEKNLKPTEEVKKEDK